jgi:rhamnosyltransferase subunit B
MSNVVLMPFGSAGDVFPFIWLGKLLKSRGHRVTLVSTVIFEEAVASAGIDFIGLGTIEEVEAIGKDRRIWKLGIGSKVVLDYAVKWSERYFEAVEGLEAVDLMMAPLTCFGARLAREKLGIPLITVHLQPMVFISAYETPLLHPSLKWFGSLPVGVKKLLFSQPNLVDLFALPGIRKLCEKHSVIPPKSLWREWWDSPDGVLALFPEWLAKPQPDWPANLLQWDFPMEDLAKEMPVSEELADFLAAGEKPIIFTPGSANIQAEKFFATAMEAVKRLGLRALFVTRMDLEIPDEMGSKILKVDFVPFSKVLEQASAFVHHGGIGTMAQGFRAGVPQLVMAMAHDQPDNGARLEKLGAGIALTAGNFTPDRVTRELGRLLTEDNWRQAAGYVKIKTVEKRENNILIDWLEKQFWDVAE